MLVCAPVVCTGLLLFFSGLGPCYGEFSGRPNNSVKGLRLRAGLRARAVHGAFAFVLVGAGHLMDNFGQIIILCWRCAGVRACGVHGAFAFVLVGSGHDMDNFSAGRIIL